MKNKKRFAASLLALALAASLLAGCAKEEPVVEEDTHAKITVTQEELVPEITDEDLGIIRKDPAELWKITGYQSWNTNNFLIMEKNDGTQFVTVAVEDKPYYDALYNARLSVYLDISYASVDPTDQMYVAYASGLRSLGSAFYEEIAQRSSDRAEQLDELSEEETPVEDEDTDSESQTEEPAQEEPQEEEPAQEEVQEGSGDAPLVPGDEALLEAADEVQSAEDFAENGSEPSAVAVSAQEDREALKAAIDEYMQTVSLNKLTGCTVYDLEGVQLGDLTAAKICDYVAQLEVELVPYELSGSSMYVSDLFPGVSYSVAAAPGENGRFELSIKNDVAKPLVMYIKSEHQDVEVPMFLNYGPTDKSLGWEAPEQEWSTSGTDEEFVVRIEQFNNDADLAASLSDTQILKVSDINAKRVFYLDETEAIASLYSVVINDTELPRTFVADTGDVIELEPFQAKGLHYAAYGSLRLEPLEEEEDW